jgi:hypothetical protein
VGGFTLALPFLPSMALAASPTPRKRFIGIYNANGVVPSKWFPASDAKTVLGTNIRELNLTSISGNISDTFDSRFNRYKSKMLMIRGTDSISMYMGGGHSTNFMLGGRHNIGGDGGTIREAHVTIDQVMAQSSKFYPTAPNFRSIQARAHGDWVGTSLSSGYSGSRVVELPGIDNPVTLFNKLFKDLPSGGGGTTSPSDKLKIQNKNVVDLVLEDFKSLTASRKLSSEDKAAVESHIDFINDLENRLQVISPQLCTAPDIPGSFTQNWAMLPQVAEAQMKNIAAAIKCGLTSLATLEFTHWSDNSFYNKALPSLTTSLHHHDMSHNGDQANLQILRKFWAGNVANLLDLLDVVEDPNTGATFLDNSIVYWGSENHEGQTHSKVDMPVTLFGSGGGYLKTGRLLDYRNMSKPTGNTGYTGFCCGKTYYHGRPYNELLITLLQAMGLGPADYEQNGQVGFGDYEYDTPTAQLPANELAAFRLDLGDKRSILPFIKA